MKMNSCVKNISLSINYARRARVCHFHTIPFKQGDGGYAALALKIVTICNWCKNVDRHNSKTDYNSHNSWNIFTILCVFVKCKCLEPSYPVLEQITCQIVRNLGKYLLRVLKFIKSLYFANFIELN